ncbi:hypothetical protein KC19_4G262100 [Ceratodon purpureus]|uniref:Uncharacterized protein n=1 Tax=Ceratodon purpureus TaxID=3225 RepID=A0A8T0IGG7_CERPU|nr:hypothetical protein KC19_4G262100 [Ceratodon purpureus]
MKAMSLVQRTSSLASLAHSPLPQRVLTAVARRGSSNVCGCGVRSLSSGAASSSVATGPEHATFVREVAAMEPPASLQALLSVLQAKGESVVSPYSTRRGVIPLAIPLTETAEGEMTALLRWPTPASGMDVPVVRVKSFGVTLLAKSPEEFIHRALVEEDAAGSSGRIAECAGEVGSGLYRRGDFELSKSSSVDVYLMKKVGLFPDVFERLAMRHFDNGDNISALVTGEYYASKKHFPGFGRPFVFNAELMLKVGRKLEAKDAARCALRSPWWTLGSSYADVANIAGWGEEQIEFMRERVSEEGRREDLLKGKDLAQVAVDQAAFLLDLAAVDCTWDDVREQLANFYKEAGFDDIARFVSTV